MFSITQIVHIILNKPKVNKEARSPEEVNIGKVLKSTDQTSAGGALNVLLRVTIPSLSEGSIVAALEEKLAEEQEILIIGAGSSDFITKSACCARVSRKRVQS